LAWRDDASQTGCHRGSRKENRAAQKSVDDYRRLMADCFKEYFRVLKPGRWMTVVFSNTQAAVWNGLQTAMQQAGFVVANVSALDKQQGSFKAVTTAVAVKQDLVISAYKPNGGLEQRFAETWRNAGIGLGLRADPLEATSRGEDERWRTGVRRRTRSAHLCSTAWWRGSSGTARPCRFPARSFRTACAPASPNATAWSSWPSKSPSTTRSAHRPRKRRRWSCSSPTSAAPSTGRRIILKARPSTYQDIHPEFIKQLGAGWKKHETRPELSALLEANFLRFEGAGEVPSQIHRYLSTNYHDLRGLEKNDPRLIAKAQDRWYVPDPNKAQDLEKKREKALLKEFEHYKTFTGRKIKESRLEVLRAGFRAAWAGKDYATILAIAHKLPDETLQEDEKLLRHVVLAPAPMPHHAELSTGRRCGASWPTVSGCRPRTPSCESARRN
jgi:hypothetical protein